MIRDADDIALITIGLTAFTAAAFTLWCIIIDRINQKRIVEPKYTVSIRQVEKAHGSAEVIQFSHVKREGREC